MTARISPDGFIWSGRARFHPQLHDRLVPIDSVQPHPDNYNNGDVELIVESLMENGCADDVLVQRSTGYIIHGNHTWVALKELDSEVCAVDYRDLDDIGALKLMVAMNVTASKAKPDMGLLVGLLDRIEQAEGDTVGTGIDKVELETLRAIEERPLEIDTDPYDGWPTFSAQIAPETFRLLMELTEDAETNRERLELLLKMAGGQA